MTSPEYISRKSPSRSSATVADFTMIVRPPGNPFAIRVFTAAEVAQADQYAASVGAKVENLPLPYPSTFSE